MRTSIVKIGDAQGVILPKSFLDELGKNTKVDIESKDGTVLIKPVTQSASQAWRNAIINETSEKNDNSLFTDLSNEFDLGELNS